MKEIYLLNFYLLKSLILAKTCTEFEYIVIWVENPPLTSESEENCKLPFNQKGDVFYILFAEVKDKNKRQPINIRDDCWLVMAHKKALVEKYLKVGQK